jgi:hypothetical protein
MSENRCKGRRNRPADTLRGGIFESRCLLKQTGDERDGKATDALAMKLVGKATPSEGAPPYR